MELMNTSFEASTKLELIDTLQDDTMLVTNDSVTVIAMNRLGFVPKQFQKYNYEMIMEYCMYIEPVAQLYYNFLQMQQQEEITLLNAARTQIINKGIKHGELQYFQDSIDVSQLICVKYKFKSIPEKFMKQLQTNYQQIKFQLNKTMQTHRKLTTQQTKVSIIQNNNKMKTKKKAYVKQDDTSRLDFVKQNQQNQLEKLLEHQAKVEQNQQLMLKKKLEKAAQNVQLYNERSKIVLTQLNNTIHQQEQQASQYYESQTKSPEKSKQITYSLSGVKKVKKLGTEINQFTTKRGKYRQLQNINYDYLAKQNEARVVVLTNNALRASELVMTTQYQSSCANASKYDEKLAQIKNNKEQILKSEEEWKLKNIQRKEQTEYRMLKHNSSQICIKKAMKTELQRQRNERIQQFLQQKQEDFANGVRRIESEIEEDNTKKQQKAKTLGKFKQINYLQAQLKSFKCQSPQYVSIQQKILKQLDEINNTPDIKQYE